MSEPIGPCHVEGAGVEGGSIFDDATRTWQATAGNPDVARVFAAGPELLAMCEEILKAAKLELDAGGVSCIDEPELTALIAKAKGQG